MKEKKIVIAGCILIIFWAFVWNSHAFQPVNGSASNPFLQSQENTATDPSQSQTEDASEGGDNLKPKVVPPEAKNDSDPINPFAKKTYIASQEQIDNFKAYRSSLPSYKEANGECVSGARTGLESMGITAFGAVGHNYELAESALGKANFVPGTWEEASRPGVVSVFENYSNGNKHMSAAVGTNGTIDGIIRASDFYESGAGTIKRSVFLPQNDKIYILKV